MKLLEKIGKINASLILAGFSIMLSVVGSATIVFLNLDIKIVIGVFMLPAVVFALVAIVFAINNFSVQTETMSMDIPRTDSPGAN